MQPYLAIASKQIVLKSNLTVRCYESPNESAFSDVIRETFYNAIVSRWQYAAKTFIMDPGFACVGEIKRELFGLLSVPMPLSVLTTCQGLAHEHLFNRRALHH